MPIHSCRSHDIPATCCFVDCTCMPLSGATPAAIYSLTGLAPSEARSICTAATSPWPHDLFRSLQTWSPSMMMSPLALKVREIPHPPPPGHTRARARARMHVAFRSMHIQWNAASLRRDVAFFWALSGQHLHRCTSAALTEAASFNAAAAGVRFYPWRWRQWLRLECCTSIGGLPGFPLPGAPPAVADRPPFSHAHVHRVCGCAGRSALND